MPHTSGCCSQETCRNVWVISVTTRICASWTSSDFATAQLLELFELLEGRSVGPDIGLRKGKTVRRQGENIRVNISTAPPPHPTPPHPRHGTLWGSNPWWRHHESQWHTILCVNQQCAQVWNHRIASEPEDAHRIGQHQTDSPALPHERVPGEDAPLQEMTHPNGRATGVPQQFLAQCVPSKRQRLGNSEPTGIGNRALHRLQHALQAGIRCLGTSASLKTGRVLNRNHWTARRCHCP